MPQDAPRPPKPITPDEIRQREDITEYAIEETVKYINGILSLGGNVALLQRGKSVGVWDKSQFHLWLAGIEGAVQLFKEAGWGIETFGEGELYLFSLPLLPEPTLEDK